MTRKVTTLPVVLKTVAVGNDDPTRVAIDRIIIHTMVGTATSADARFNNSASKVSAHYGILQNGQIWHWVDEDRTAYQAGVYAMNQRSIGIEHEDMGDYNGIRPDILYNTSAQLVADICKFYGIPCDRQHILKHSEVKATGCPDALDIDRIVKQAQAILIPTVSMEMLPKDVIIGDIYEFLTGSRPNQDTINWRLSTNKNIVDIGTDICQGDLAFFNKWIKPQILTQPTPEPLIDPKLQKQVNDLTALIQTIKNIVFGKGWPWTKIAKEKQVFA